jgi:flagellar protein FlgJ
MINSSNDISGSLAVDVQGVNQLKLAAKQNSPEALKGAAKQFEALFMNMIMKSMREASSQDGIFDNEQTKMYTSMLDQQISQSMANRGIGLADMLVRQLSSVNGKTAVDALSGNKGLSPAAGSKPINGNQSPSSHALHMKAFQEQLAPHAEAASRETGIPAKFMLGQAALESGWGRREIKGADGTPSHNLFGIKATPDWKGKVVEAPTTEYVNGVPETRMEKFRAYDSYADSFQDYARFLSSNPRYGSVLANSRDAVSFAQGLQQAGYATDPNYAAKLARIINQSLSV